MSLTAFVVIATLASMAMAMPYPQGANAVEGVLVAEQPSSKNVQDIEGTVILNTPQQSSGPVRPLTPYYNENAEGLVQKNGEVIVDTGIPLPIPVFKLPEPFNSLPVNTYPKIMRFPSERHFVIIRAMTGAGRTMQYLMTEGRQSVKHEVPKGTHTW